MTYARVVPRDLFNEGDLLNCLGRLWIKLDERRDHNARLAQVTADRFLIEQDPADGSILCNDVLLFVDNSVVPMFRPLNARSKWPLWALFDDEDVRVFDEQTGDLSTEFWVQISQPELVRQRREWRS
jgi:hypothetical protein